MVERIQENFAEKESNPVADVSFPGNNINLISRHADFLCSTFVLECGIGELPQIKYNVQGIKFAEVCQTLHMNFTNKKGCVLLQRGLTFG